MPQREMNILDEPHSLKEVVMEREINFLRAADTSI